MTHSPLGSHDASFPGAQGPNPPGLQAKESKINLIVELICPNCGEACLADPANFPAGRSAAACSACDGELTLVKSADGRLAVEASMPSGLGENGKERSLDGRNARSYQDENAGQGASSRQDESSGQGARPHEDENGGQGSGPHEDETPWRDEALAAKLEPLKPDPPTHPVVCPNCLRRYRVPWSKIPKQGAWVTCPACSERFIIKLEDSGFLDYQPEEAKGGSGKGSGKSLGKRPPGLDQASPKSSKGAGPYYIYRPGEEVPGELLVTMLDPVTPKARRYWGLGLVAVLLLVFAVEAIVLRSSWMSARDMAELEDVSPPPPPVYDERSLASDLRKIQEATVASNRLDRRIEHTGGESRVFKYATAILAPESCSAITMLTMRSSAPAMGLSLKATCLDPAQTAESLEIVWNGRYAELFLTGRDRLRRVNVLLHQPSPEVAAAQARAAAEAEAANLAAEKARHDDEAGDAADDTAEDENASGELGPEGSGASDGGGQ